MKRVILLFAAVLLASIGWSQTMVVTLNDGTTVKYDMGIVKSIDFTSESSDNGNTDNNDGNKSIEQLLVGTWMPSEVIDSGWLGELIEKLKESPCLKWEEVKCESLTQFRSDGTAFKAQYKDGEFEIVKYYWTKMNDKEIHFVIAEGKYAGMSSNALIQQIDSDKMVVSQLGVTGMLIRVPDNNFESFIEYYGNK